MGDTETPLALDLRLNADASNDSSADSRTLVAIDRTTGAASGDLTTVYG